MPQVDLARRPKNKRAMAAGVGAVVALVLIVVVVFAIKYMADHPPLTTQKALDNASAKTFSGDNDGAIAILKPQLGHTKSNDEKVEIYLALAAAYEDKKDYKTAMEMNSKAGDLRAGFGIYRATARTAEAAGNKAVALDYYQRSREFIKSGKANQAGGELPSIEEAIVRLGGKL